MHKSILNELNVELSIAQCASELYLMQYSDLESHRATALFALYSSQLIPADLFHVKQYAFLDAYSLMRTTQQYALVKEQALKEYALFINDEESVYFYLDTLIIDFSDVDFVKECRDATQLIHELCRWFYLEASSLLTLLPVRFPEICFRRYIEALGYNAVKDCFEDELIHNVNIFA